MGVKGTVEVGEADADGEIGTVEVGKTDADGVGETEAEGVGLWAQVIVAVTRSDTTTMAAKSTKRNLPDGILLSFIDYPPEFKFSLADLI